MSKISRRKFIKNACKYSALGSISLTSPFFSLKPNSNQLLAQSNSDDLKVLVVYFALGGFHGVGSVLRGDNYGYSAYKQARPMLALDKKNTIELKHKDSKGNPVLLSKHYKEIAELVNNGLGCIVPSVGLTNVPLSNSKDPINDSKIIFHSNYVRSRAQWHMSAISAADKKKGGVLGRILDTVNHLNAGALHHSSVTTSSNDLMSKGNTANPLLLNANNIYSKKKNSLDIFNSVRNFKLDNILESSLEELLTETPSVGSHLNFLETDKIISNSKLSNTYFDRLAKKALSLIYHAKKGNLGNLKRLTIYLTDYGNNWATHQRHLELSTRHGTQFSQGIYEFFSILDKFGAVNNTTLMTASQFGRTATEKFVPQDKRRTSSTIGTDIGWANHHFIFGGNIEPGIHGEIPALKAGEKGILQRRTKDLVLIPQYSTDQYFATAGKWFGLPDNKRNEVFSNLKNFQQKDIGFMKT